MQDATSAPQRQTRYIVLSVMAVLLFGAVQITWGEKIQVGHGLGWDGSLYASIVRNFREQVFGERLTSYRLQRVLPSGVIALALTLVKAEKSFSNIIRAFEIYNLVLLLISAVVWNLIADELRIKPRTRWLGFTLLFLSFPMAKQNFFYPVLTDTSAFTLGMVLAYAFLRRNAAAVLLCAVVGSFVWPSFFYSAALLFLFPAGRPAGGGSVPTSLNVAAAGAVSAGAVLGLLFFRYVLRVSPPVPLHEGLVPLSLLLVGAYTFALALPLLNYAPLYTPKMLVGLLRPVHLIALGAVFVGLKAAVGRLDNLSRALAFDHRTVLGFLGFYEMKTFVASTLFLAVTKPAIFLVSHAVYFGPAALIFALCFRRASRIIHTFGVGLTLYVLLHMFMALTSESRWLINAFPFLVVVVSKVLDDLDLRTPHVWAIVIASLAFSKVWLPFNQGPMVGDLHSFPYQFYFMNHGPWMSDFSYAVQGTLVVLAVVLLRRYVFTRGLLDPGRSEAV